MCFPKTLWNYVWLREKWTPSLSLKISFILGKREIGGEGVINFPRFSKWNKNGLINIALVGNERASLPPQWVGSWWVIRGWMRQTLGTLHEKLRDINNELSFRSATPGAFPSTTVEKICRLVRAYHNCFVEQKIPFLNQLRGRVGLSFTSWGQLRTLSRWLLVWDLISSEITIVVRPIMREEKWQKTFEKIF